MIRILLSWALQFLILSGTGSLFVFMVFQRKNVATKHSWHVFHRFWFGVALVVTFLELWHLLFPVNAVCWALVAFFGAAGLPSLWRSLCGSGAHPRDCRPSPRDILAAILFLFLALAAAWRIGGVLHRTIPDDTEVYHLQIVRWTNEYPAVPGLANLNVWFGYNSAALLYAALWDNLAWNDRSAWIVSCFFELVTAAQFIWIIASPRRFPLPARVFALLTSPFFLYVADTAYPSLYYDRLTQAALFTLIAEALSLRVFLRQKPAADENALRSEILARLPFFLCLAAVCFAGKPFGAMTFLISASACALATWRWRPLLLHGRAALAKHAARIFVIPFLMMLGYFARNLILSGWLLYPAPVLNIHAQWSLQEDYLVSVFHTIRGLARIPTDVHRAGTMSFWEWFPQWRHGFDRSVEKQLFVLGAATFATLCYRNAGRRWTLLTTIVSWLMLLCAGNFAYWLVTAPDMRYAFAFFWTFMALGVGLWAVDAVRRPESIMGIALFISVYFTLQQRLTLFPTKQSHLLDWGRAREFPVRKISVPNGSFPPQEIGIAETDELVGNASLPATPFPPPAGLRLRVPGDLRWGFYIADDKSK
jgi:hypothetical protein